MDRMEIYLNEYNVLMGDTVYLPLASGQLHAYARTIGDIRDSCRFNYIFLRGGADDLVSAYENPSMAAFSVSMWNMNLSLAVAKRVKARFPQCLTVFGGPHIPDDRAGFLLRHPFVDVVAFGEGEYTFADLLVRRINMGDFRGVQGIAYREAGAIVENEPRPLENDLDKFPSPYLEGLFESLMLMGVNFQATVETNRGCPYLCSFCNWGQGRRFRYFSMERVRQVADWCGLNGIGYVFCGDSNFGMHERDMEIASYFVEAKHKYGFPRRFRACYGKDGNETIFDIGKLLADNDMEKGITLSRQSCDAGTLANVGRRGMKSEIYDELQARYDAHNIPTYSELILGLPGETYESFLHGIECLLRGGARLLIYICQIYPNTEMASPEYRARHGIRSIHIPLAEAHASIREDTSCCEYEEIVVSTASMSQPKWRRALIVSWLAQLLYGLDLLGQVMKGLGAGYTDFCEYALFLPTDTILGREARDLHNKADSILRGGCKLSRMPEYGDIYWDPEEAAYLRISEDIGRFYDELEGIIRGFYSWKGAEEAICGVCGEKVSKNGKSDLGGLIACQRACFPRSEDYESKEAFAREVIIYGRKGRRAGSNHGRKGRQRETEYTIDPQSGVDNGDNRAGGVVSG